MKKIIILFLLLIVLNGCTMEYNVTLSSNGFVYDDLFIRETFMRFMEEEPEDWHDIVYSRNHTIKLINEQDEDRAYYKINLRNTYTNYDDYLNDKYIKKYFGEYKYTEGKECTIAYTFNKGFSNYLFGDGFRPYIEELVINLSVPFSVTNSNATEVKDDVYTWTLTPDSKLEGIYITYKNPETNVDVNRISFKTIMIICFAIIIVLIVVVKKKSKKVNDL